MKSETSQWTDETVPYICWDRGWSVGEIARRLSNSEGEKRHRLMAWLMRELKTGEVWYFLRPDEVYRDFQSIQRWLGSARELWVYLFRTWHELGKF